MIKNFKDLDVWNLSIDLVKDIYEITKSFPRDEKFGIVMQMRRSAISIPSNIAEGKTRQHVKEYMQFLYVALGSCSELETQIIICKELKFMQDSSVVKILETVDHISRMLRNLVKSLTDNRKPTTANLR
jgi:four helix bundle protein